MSFVPDPNIHKVAEAYALDAVDFLWDHFRLVLDWTDDSVRHVETMLDNLHATLEVEKPSEERVFHFAKMFGSYVGEVFRRNHGATWGIVTIDNESFPGMKSAHDGVEFWPWGRAQRRLVNGPEDNIWVYYRVLVTEYCDQKMRSPECGPT